MKYDQECISFHTNKNTEETVEILKQQGWEIIYKSYSDNIDFDVLTEAEKNSWLNAFIERLKSQILNLERHDREDGSFIISTDLVKQRFEKILSMLKKNNHIPIITRYENLVSEIRIIDEIHNQITSWLHYIFVKGYPIYDRQINCSRIIAKKGTEQLRYLEFYSDPIITIAGPKAMELMSSLEKKF